MMEWWSIAKYQIPSTKLQTNLKFQYSMTKTQNRFEISKLGTRPQGGESKRRANNFGHCDLFGIFDSEFLFLQYSSVPAEQGK
jgi:hypothetical protein